MLNERQCVEVVRVLRNLDIVGSDVQVPCRAAAVEAAVAAIHGDSRSWNAMAGAARAWVRASLKRHGRRVNERAVFQATSNVLSDPRPETDLERWARIHNVQIDGVV